MNVQTTTHGLCKIEQLRISVRDDCIVYDICNAVPSTLGQRMVFHRDGKAPLIDGKSAVRRLLAALDSATPLVHGHALIKSSRTPDMMRIRVITVLDARESSATFGSVYAHIETLGHTHLQEEGDFRMSMRVKHSFKVVKGHDVYWRKQRTEQKVLKVVVEPKGQTESTTDSGSDGESKKQLSTLEDDTDDTDTDSDAKQKTDAIIVRALRSRVKELEASANRIVARGKAIVEQCDKITNQEKNKAATKIATKKDAKHGRGQPRRVTFPH